MPSKPQENELDTLKIKRPAADKIREVQRRFREHNPGSITQSEAIELMAEHYIAAKLGGRTPDAIPSPVE